MRVHALAILILITCSSIARSQSDTSSQDSVRANPEFQGWPRFLGPTYDGVANSSAAIDWNGKPTFQWALKVGDGYGIGTIADGRFFQCDTGPNDGPVIQERIRCLQLLTGKEVWSKSTPILYQDMLGYEDGPRSSPTIDGDRVFTMGVTGILTCRNVETGTQIWQIDTNKRYGVVQNFFGVGSAPLVLNNQVLVMVGGSPAEDQDIPPMRLDRVDSNGSALVALDRDTGRELWKCGNDLASYSSPRPIQLDGETLVLVFARAGLLAIDPEVGKVRWRFDFRAKILESVNAMVPVVHGDQVLISECYEKGSVLLKVSGNTAPEVVWQDPDRNRRKQSMRCHWATPVLVDGALFGCSGRNAPDSDFRCIDFNTGEVLWTDPRFIRSSVTRVGDHLLLLEERGKLQVLKANSKKLDIVTTWDLSEPAGKRPELNYPCWSAPVVVDDILLVRGSEHVLCLKLPTQ